MSLLQKSLRVMLAHAGLQRFQLVLAPRFQQGNKIAEIGRRLKYQ